ncbi:MAG: hypothetical protein VX589_14235 [Myxococcota bacterium]|nr:hypothetical protein [Myxococcota bacterium]
MIRYHKRLFGLSMGVFIIGCLLTWTSRTDAFGYGSDYQNGCIKRGNDVNCTAKSGDMYIYTSHGGYYGRSGRLGSAGNRTYRGGGVRGGK